MPADRPRTHAEIIGPVLDAIARAEPAYFHGIRLEFDDNFVGRACLATSPTPQEGSNMDFSSDKEIRAAAGVDKQNPIVTIPTRLPTHELTPIPVNSLAANMPTLVNDAQTLLSIIELSDPGTVPLEVVKAAAILHGTLAGPGASDLDLRPGSLEIVGDETLHAQAMAEAAGKRLDRLKAEQALTPDQRATLAEYASVIETQRESIRNAFEEGKAEGYEAGIEQGQKEGGLIAKLAFNATPLWRIAQQRLTAALDRWHGG